MISKMEKEPNKSDFEIQAEVDNPQSFEVGSMVEIPMAQGSPRYGVIRWIGTLPTLRDKVVAGVELEDGQNACSDGTFGGERYFTCPDRRGFFSLLEYCRQDSRFTPNSPTSDPDYQSSKEIMEDSRGANAQAPLAAGQFQGKKSPKSSRKSEREFREIQQREENLQRQLREMQQREENSQRQLRAMEQREENSQRQLREMQQREENLQRQLGEMQQRENSEEQVSSLERQLREKNQEIKELELSLLSAQRRISEQRRQEKCDWVISRDEIQMTENCLGRGGWGSVNEGTYCGCTVAVKQIHDLILSRHNRLLFEREMNIASACRHPCLLQFVGATNDEGSPLFVTELMEKSLRALLEQRQLSETEIAVISLDVALALNYLHQKKPNPIIHRDVSSANVLLWRQGDQWRGKVSDYGTANFMKQTMTVAPGNVIYSAPEALSSNQTPKVDVYSFGVLLCEMCIGELPDAEKREEQVLLMSNRALRGLVRRCLQTDPEARPAMQEIIDELSRVV